MSRRHDWPPADWARWVAVLRAQLVYIASRPELFLAHDEPGKFRRLPMGCWQESTAQFPSGRVRVQNDADALPERDGLQHHLRDHQPLRRTASQLFDGLASDSVSWRFDGDGQDMVRSGLLVESERDAAQRFAKCVMDRQAMDIQADQWCARDRKQIDFANQPVGTRRKADGTTGCALTRHVGAVRLVLPDSQLPPAPRNRIIKHERR